MVGNRAVAHDRDVDAFDRRADGYDDGHLGRFHDLVAERTVATALGAVAAPTSVLDVGCGTGAALRHLARRLPDATSLIGIDPAARMVAAARSRASDPRVRFGRGTVESLPLRSRSVDLVVAVTSFDHWADQQAGLRECARVLRPDGMLVLTDLFSFVLAPTMLATRRDHARTVRTANARLRAAGFARAIWERGALLLKTVVATPS